MIDPIIRRGNAPCGQCDRLVEVELTGEYESDGNGGWWFIVLPGYTCTCSEPFRWLHVPPPAMLELATATQHKEQAV